MAQFQSGFQKYFLLVGAVGIFGAHYGMSRAHNYFELQNQEREVAKQFKSFRNFDNGLKMPNVQVAGPRGDIIDLSNTDEKFTVLNVWATWCAPCVQELPSLKSLDITLRRKGGWRVIAVSIDSKKNIDKMFKFTKKLGVGSIANYFDHNNELQKVFNVKKLPATYIINADGDILYEIQGDARWYDKEILSFLDLVKLVR